MRAWIWRRWSRFVVAESRRRDMTTLNRIFNKHHSREFFQSWMHGLEVLLLQLTIQDVCVCVEGFGVRLGLALTSFDVLTLQNGNMLYLIFSLFNI